MGQYMLYVWLAVLCIGLVIEVIEAGTLVSIWFSVGAVIPLFMSIWRTNSAIYIASQFVVFGLFTICSLVFIRKIARNALLKNVTEKTNLDSYIDKKFKIVETNNDLAYIKISGVSYAVYDEDDKLEVGDQVVVKKFMGNKAVVEKL